MKSVRYMLAAIPGVLSVFAASSAYAEEKEAQPAGGDLFSEQTPTVSNALELGVAAGYAQGVGDIAKGRGTVQDLSGPGGAFEVDVGYRLSPQFMIGVYGTGAQFAKGDSLADGTDVRSVTAGVQANYHFRPNYTVDPWVGLGSGWRGLWLSPDAGKDTSMQGWELARLQVGADYRISPEVAITPVLGADLSMYLTENGPGLSGYTNISDPRVNVAFFAGIGARFDVLGKTGGTTASASQNASY
jgi:outer membrane protein W